MRYVILPLVLIAVLIVSPNASPARGLGKVVTKATQKEFELEYDLSAVREPEAVIISMTISKDGKLRDLRQVRLSILADNKKNFLIRAPLEMSELDGRVRVSAQLDPELAANASLDLVVEEGRSEYYYAVSVAGYITDRNDEK